MNIEKLIKLCDEHFKDPFVQFHSGGTYECMYCGTTMIDERGAHHSAQCPATRYAEILREE